MSDPVSVRATPLVQGASLAPDTQAAVAARDWPTAAVILAAGKSTRMRSRLPKPLHPVCGLPMTGHVIRACRAAGVERIVVIVGHEAEAVRIGLGDTVEYALQETQRGTGDAVRAAFPLLVDWQGAVLVLAGDVPLLSGMELRRLIDLQKTTGASVALLTAMLENPTGYGRIVRDSKGRVARIVEERDADTGQRAIHECNPSIYIYDSATLWPTLANLQTDNAQGEFYLTDTISLLARAGRPIEALTVTDSRDVLGVNTRIELAEVTAILRRRLLDTLMLSGVTITDPTTTYVDIDVEVGQDTVIEPHTFVLAGTRTGEECRLGPFTRIERSVLGDRVQVLASVVAESTLADGVRVGPFAHLRPGARLGTKVKIGNFVEVKNATLGAGAQASHLSYLGDAEIGEGANIGAGAITCNYDGYHKHRTVIGRRAFIGSNSTLVAPVTIGDGAFIAAASAITQDVPEDALGIARSRPSLKEGWAADYRARQSGSAQQTGQESPKESIS